MTTPDELRAELLATELARTIDHLRDWLQRAETSTGDEMPGLLGEGMAHVGALLEHLDREQGR